MFHKMKISKTYIKRIDSDYKSQVEIKYDGSKSDLLFISNELGNSNWSGIDLLDSFIKLRDFIENEGFLILVNGARKNSWPSGFLRDSSNGLLTYIYDKEEKETFNILDFYDSDIVTYKEQLQLYNDW